MAGEQTLDLELLNELLVRQGLPPLPAVPPGKQAKPPQFDEALNDEVLQRAMPMPPSHQPPPRATTMDALSKAKGIRPTTMDVRDKYAGDTIRRPTPASSGPRMAPATLTQRINAPIQDAYGWLASGIGHRNTKPCSIGTKIAGQRQGVSCAARATVRQRSETCTPIR